MTADLAYPTWRCPSGHVNDLLNGACRVCKQSRPCQSCGGRPARLYTSGMWCDSCESGAAPALKPSAPPEPAPLPEYPEPEVPAREAHGTEIPRGGTTFLKKIMNMPHDVRYAKGWLPDAQGKPSKLVESVVIRIAPVPFVGVRVVLTWIDGKSAGCLYLDAQNALRKGNLDDARRILGFEVKPRAPRAPAKPRLTLIKGGKEGMR